MWSTRPCNLCFPGMSLNKKAIMRTLFPLLSLFLFHFLTLPLQAQRVSGSGTVAEEQRSLPAFHTIEVSKGIDLFIRQGNTQKVMVKADDNLLNRVKTEVNGGTLTIHPEGSIRQAKALDVYITVQSIERIEANSGSDVRGESILKSETLALKMGSGSDVDLDLRVGQLTCNLSSGSDVSLSGEADLFVAEASGGSDINARKLLVRKCTLHVSGGSDAHIHVEGELEVEASSASDVYIKGNPQILSQRASGGSDIRSR